MVVDLARQVRIVLPRALEHDLGAIRELVRGEVDFAEAPLADEAAQGVVANGMEVWRREIVEERLVRVGELSWAVSERRRARACARVCTVGPRPAYFVPLLLQFVVRRRPEARHRCRRSHCRTPIRSLPHALPLSSCCCGPPARLVTVPGWLGLLRSGGLFALESIETEGFGGLIEQTPHVDTRLGERNVIIKPNPKSCPRIPCSSSWRTRVDRHWLPGPPSLGPHQPTSPDLSQHLTRKKARASIQAKY